MFTNVELSPDEKANYLQQIQDFFGEDSAIVISLKPQIEETETLQKQYDDAVTKFGENSQKILEILNGCDVNGVGVLYFDASVTTYNRIITTGEKPYKGKVITMGVNLA